MKSIKPGRGPSALGAVGSIGAVLFGVFWTIMAFSITRDSPFPLVGTIFPLFGLIFIGIGIANAVFHYKNATSKDRMSLLDITDNREEPDPLNLRFGGERNSTTNDPVRRFEGEFCPFCGTKVQTDFNFCPKCGKDI
ncbi:zinc ribbon domain-containing protein [Ammoniphilus sp. YIM 78166]|uniref:zinc ribbon domain-containing protein n=1 Tax=Ammoniphilus sp. YIM 78166 TaxID=1644106 RepID=UPI00106FFC8F|nr:zinc ribbon domain-containing protein [Ammoniphilus sp. YIM 78166]